MGHLGGMLGGVWARLVTGCVEEVQGIVMMLLLMVIMERAAQGTSLLYRCDSNSLRGETIRRPRDKRNVEKPLAGQQTKEKKKTKTQTFVLFSFLKCSPTASCITATLRAANHSTGAKARSPGGTSLQKEEISSNCIPRKHKTVRLH